MRTEDPGPGKISRERQVVSGSSAPSEIEVQWSKANGYAMMLISAAKPAERPARYKCGDADTPDQKHSHYRKWQDIDPSQTERLKRIPQRRPQEEIQQAEEQKQSE